MWAYGKAMQKAFHNNQSVSSCSQICNLWYRNWVLYNQATGSPHKNIYLVQKEEINNLNWIIFVRDFMTTLKIYLILKPTLFHYPDSCFRAIN
jgi:hypothetical protein